MLIFNPASRKRPISIKFLKLAILFDLCLCAPILIYAVFQTERFYEDTDDLVNSVIVCLMNIKQNVLFLINQQGFIDF